MNLNHRAVYAAFDLFPTSKGAATHISHMAKFLFEKYNGGLLLTLGNQYYPRQEVEEYIEIRRFSENIPNYLQRAQAFTNHVIDNISQLPTLEIVHFRDVWSGLGILQQERNYKALFEVNGLPSIELPYRYPGLLHGTLDKIQQMEAFCFEHSDHLIAPSQVIKEHLISRGVPHNKIDVVTNAASPAPTFEKVQELPERFILYFGAVQPWQGIDTLLKAFALLKDISPLKLVICCAGKPKLTKVYRKLSEKLGISDNIIWQYRIGKSELNTYIKEALLTVAPLKECSRNVEQGCSPLKIFESMACRTAVVASDLPVTREIIQNGITGKLVRPDRPQELSRAIRLMLEYPEQRKAIADAGYEQVSKKYNWENIKQQMFQIYEQRF